MDVLNEARVKHGKAVNDSITWLEQSLRNQNRGQGSGW